jgi:hypothetical protein
LLQDYFHFIRRIARSLDWPRRRLRDNFLLSPAAKRKQRRNTISALLSANEKNAITVFAATTPQHTSI